MRLRHSYAASVAASRSGTSHCCRFPVMRSNAPLLHRDPGTGRALPRLRAGPCSLEAQGRSLRPGPWVVPGRARGGWAPGGPLMSGLRPQSESGGCGTTP